MAGRRQSTIYSVNVKTYLYLLTMFDVLTKVFSRVSDLLGVEWAPLDIPMSRRLQTLATAVWMAIVLVGEGTCIYLYIKWLYSDYWLLALFYGYWMLNDVNICNRGGRRFEWVRNWKLWRYYCDYFPIKLVKTTELDPSKNYLFACYPHGLLAQGAVGSFGTNALGFYEKFPKMTVNFITLGGHFLVPFFRDFILALGVCSCEENSLLYLLDRKRYKGNCVAMMIGGAAEALDSHPGQYKVILNRRKGFIRVAMKSGASLVPVFSFGETDVFRPFENPDDSFLRRFQEKVKQVTGISPMFPVGRGLFQYSFGLLPLRNPITTVVGAPIELKKNLEPSKEEIDEVHTEFTKRLIELFESEKKNYLKNAEDTKLVIV